MAGHSFEDQSKAWNNMLGYISRGTEGEAGIELREAVWRHKSGEHSRWTALIKEFPYAITGLDPAESLRPVLAHSKVFDEFVPASHAWLNKEFADRPNEFWEEMASVGCYWIRFKFESDLKKYTDAFAVELNLLGFKPPEDERT